MKKNGVLAIWTKTKEIELEKALSFCTWKYSKKSLFSVESIFERDFLEISTAFKKSTCGKWKIGLFSNRIRLNFKNQLSRTTIHFTLKTSGKSCVQKWRVWSKRAIVLSSKLNNNGCQDWDNAHSRKPLHCKKNLTIAANFKANTVWHLTYSNCQLDRRINNTEIAESVNKQGRFSELLETYVLTRTQYPHRWNINIGFPFLIFWQWIIQQPERRPKCMVISHINFYRKENLRALRGSCKSL